MKLKFEFSEKEKADIREVLASKNMEWTDQMLESMSKTEFRKLTKMFDNYTDDLEYDDFAEYYKQVRFREFTSKLQQLCEAQRYL